MPHLVAETSSGIAVFRFGLKNGSDTTVAVVFMRCASIVSSIWSFAPGFEYSAPTLASAINFFSNGRRRRRSLPHLPVS